MIYIILGILAFTIIAAITATGFAITLFRNPANRSRSVFTKYLVINAFAAAGIAFSIHNALPDTKPDPLENYLPTEWRHRTELVGGTAQWADHFTAEQDEAARAKSQVLQAIQTNTVVDAYVTVHEGDVDALKRTLEHQITISGSRCPASTIFAGWRQSVLPVHLLGLAPLLGSVGPVAGDVKLQDDGVVHDPVNRRGGGHGVGKDALPLREDQV